MTKFLKGKQFKGQDVYGYLDPPKPWGGFGFYFLGSRATAYAKHPGRQGLAVRRRHHEAAHQQPGLGARHPGRPRRAALRAGRPDQRRPEQHRLPAVPRRHRLDDAPGGATSARTPRPTTARSSATSAASRHPARLGRRLQCQDRRVGQARERARTTRPTWPISAGASTSWRASTATRRSRRRRGAPRRISAARTSRCGPRPIRPASSPTATATSTSRSGSPPATTRPSSPTISSPRPNSYNHPNAAIEPRIPGIFQYYSVAEDELAKTFAGQDTPRPGADNIAAAWEKLTEQIGRDKQIKLYKASLGM